MVKISLVIEINVDLSNMVMRTHTTIICISYMEDKLMHFITIRKWVLCHRKEEERGGKRSKEDERVKKRRKE